MASGGENEDWNWPNSGQDGPDFSWEHVPIPPIPPIPSKSTEENKSEEGKKEEKLPTVEDVQLGGEDSEEEKPLEPLRRPKVRTLERYNPSPEELKALPDNMDEIFDKHGDDIIIEETDGKRHIYYFFGETEGQKHYKCIKENCHSSLVVEEYMEPPTPPPKEDSNSEESTPKEDHKEDSKEDKRAKEGNPKEEGPEENEDWNS